MLRQRYLTIILDGLRPTGERAPGSRSTSSSSTGSRNAARSERGEQRASDKARRDGSDRHRRRVHRGARQLRPERCHPDDPARSTRRCPHSMGDRGYADLATLLIIGGRLGDVYGHRRIFMSARRCSASAHRRLVAGRAGLILEGHHRGHRRCSAAGHLAILGHLPRPGSDSLRRGARPRACVCSRTGRRRVPHDQLLVAMGVRHQRDRGAADPRRRSCS